MEHLRRANYIGERCFLGIEIDDAPIRQLQGSNSTLPDVKRNRSHVRDVKNRLFIIAHEVANVPLSILAPDRNRAHPVWRELRRILLIKRFAFDSVGESRENDRT